MCECESVCESMCLCVCVCVLEKCTAAAAAAAAAARVEAGRVEILRRYDKAKYRGLNCGGGGGLLRHEIWTQH